MSRCTLCLALSAVFLSSGAACTGSSGGSGEDESSDDTSGTSDSGDGDATSSASSSGDGDGDGDASTSGDGDGDGDGDADSPGGLDFGSGTRLRAEVWRTDANTRLFRRWWDSERSEYCSFEETVSGTRCVPNGPRNWDRLYADAGCTEPVVAEFDVSCQGDPGYALVLGDFDACVEARPLTVHAIGPEHTGAVYGVDSDAGCIEWDQPNTYWTVGLAIDDTAFVSAQVSAEADGDTSNTVSPARLEAEDGAWRRTHVADMASSQRMGTRVLEDDAEHYYMSTAVMEWSTDATCLSPIAGAYDCAAQPAHVLEVDSGATDPCVPAPARVYAVGDAYTGELWQGIGTCSPDSPDNWPDYAFYEVQQPALDPSALVTVTRVNGSVDGDRLSLDALGADDEPWLFDLQAPVRLTDANFSDVLCSFQLADDGELYCFPDHRGWSIAYADDTCTTPVARWLGGMGNGGLACLPSTPPAAFPVSVSSSDACEPATYRAFALGDPIADQQVWLLNGQGQCNAGTVTAGLYAGEEIELSDLAHVQLLIE